MEDTNTTTIRVKKTTHDILRWIAYRDNKSITEIMDETFRDKGPNVDEKIDSLLKGK